MRRIQVPLLFVASIVAAAGCRTRPAAGLTEFDCDPQTGVCIPGDAGSPDTGLPDAGSPAGDGSNDSNSGAVTVQIASPASPAYTNGSITIQIAFSPATAAPVSADLFDGDTKLATVSAPFAFVWDTTAAPSVSEGPHQITARATLPGGAISSDPVTIIVDRTAPTIASQSPSPGATNVLFSDPIQVVFSEAIDPATLAGAITLSTSAGTVATTALLAPDGKTVNLTLTDRRSVPLPADVTVAAKATIADLAGNQLGPVATWSWNAPLWVKLPKLSGKYPEIALGADDRPLVLSAVEQGAVGSNDFILQIARLGSARTWDTTTPSPQGPRPASLVPARAALALGADGLPVLAWPEAAGSNPSTIHVARWTGSVWDTSYGQLDAVAGAGTAGANPAVAFSPAGDLFVSWAEPNPTASAVFTSKWAGTVWDSSYGNVGVAGATEPVIRFGADGQPVLAFYASLSTSGAAQWSGTAWSPLPAYTNAIQMPSLAIDPSGVPVVTSIAGTEQYVRLMFLNSMAWVEQIPAIPTGVQPRDAQLIMPSDGHPVVAWTEVDSTTGARIVGVARHDGAEWDFAYGSLDGFVGANSDGATPRMVLDQGGSPIVTWQETDGSVQSTYVWRSNH
jgi:hypothetical protein